jgi:hypothetical protein
MKRAYGAFLAVVVFCMLLLTANAGAATVVNGDFETGSLSGWQIYNSDVDGSWETYSAAEAFEFFPPPSGNFAAVSAESGSVTMILYQDIALEPYSTHQLGLTLYYHSYAPISAPNTLATDESVPTNQQLRVDVIKPTAPIESLNPEDILATVFANKNGDPEVMAPTHLTADLSSLAGQTVRLRVANAVHDFYFNAGLDAVSIASAPIPNAITRGKLTLNKKNGTGKLKINVPGPGTLNVVSKGKKKLVKSRNLSATGPATLIVPLNPTAKGKKILNSKGKLKVPLQATYTPTGGTAGIQVFKVTLRKTLK